MALRLNVRSGLLRLWIFLSICWIALFAGLLGERNISVVIAPPVVFGILLAGLVWVAEGFKVSATSRPTLRAREVAEGGDEPRPPATQSNPVASEEPISLWTDHPWFISNGVEVIECSEALSWTHGYRRDHEKTANARLQELQAGTSDRLQLYQCDISEQTEDSSGRQVWKYPAERAAFLAAEEENVRAAEERKQKYEASIKKKKRIDRITNYIVLALLIAGVIWYSRNAHFRAKDFNDFWTTTTKVSLSAAGLWIVYILSENLRFWEERGSWLLFWIALVALCGFAVLSYKLLYLLLAGLYRG